MDLLNILQEYSDLILEKGEFLSEYHLKIAKKIGIKYPEKIKIFVGNLDDIEDIKNPILSLINKNAVGMTLGYSILLKNKDDKIISHELKHVYQFENIGSLDKFVLEYINQIFTFGYLNAPYEIDARKYENITMKERHHANPHH